MRISDWSSDVCSSDLLAQHEIQIVGIVERERLDRVGDVWNHLDGRAQIIATALALDDLAVDPPRGDVVALVRGDAGEALVMAQIEVGLRPVVGDVDLAVLIGRHRARIDVRSEEHTSELQSLMRISYAVF